MKNVVKLILFSACLCVNLSFKPAFSAKNYDQIEVNGSSRISPETIRSISGLFKNQEISSVEINQGLKNLVGSGLFSEVEIKIKGNSLLIIVLENPQINIIAFEGNKIIEDSDILAVIGLKERDPLDENKVKTSIVAIKELYRKKAYLSTQVSAQKISRGEGIFDLVYEIEEGALSEIENILFIGNNSFSNRELLKVIPSRQKGIFSGLFSSDDFGEEVLSRDRDAIIKFYKSSGFKDVSVAFSKGLYSQATNDFAITYSIVEGNQYSIGNIVVKSEIPTISDNRIKDMFLLKPGDILNESFIVDSLSNINSYIKNQGHKFGQAYIDSSERELGSILDLEIMINERDKKFVERIEINGNLSTTDRVLRREFTFSELDPLVPAEIYKTRENLLALGFFRQVDILSKEGSEANKEVVVVNVEEKPTGSLTLGLSYSTDNDVGGQVSLNERNFLGLGQRLQFVVKNGSVAQEYSFGFMEPEFLGRDVSASIDVSYNEGTPKQNTSVTKNTSVSPSLTFQITEASRMTLGYDFIDTVASTSTNSSVILKNEPSNRTSSIIAVNLNIDKRDSIIKPKRGYIVSVTSKYAGLGGNREYSKSTGKGRIYFPLITDSIVVSSEIEAGTLSMNNGTSTASERFYLGGRTLRGFQYGGVGPRDLTVNESLGGTNYTVGRAEVSFPLGLPKELNMYGGIFGELGKVWGLDASVPSGTNVNLDDSIRSSVGVSLYWSTPIGPLQFNWAYPQDYVSGVDKLERFSLNLSTMF